MEKAYVNMSFIATTTDWALLYLWLIANPTNSLFKVGLELPTYLRFDVQVRPIISLASIYDLEKQKYS